MNNLKLSNLQNFPVSPFEKQQQEWLGLNGFVRKGNKLSVQYRGNDI